MSAATAIQTRVGTTGDSTVVQGTNVFATFSGSTSSNWLSALAACGVAPAASASLTSGTSASPSTSTAASATSTKSTLFATRTSQQISAEMPAPTTPAVDSSALIPAETSAASDALQQTDSFSTADAEIDSQLADGKTLVDIASTELVSSPQNGISTAPIQCEAACGQSGKIESAHTQQSGKGTNSRSSSAINEAKSSPKSSEQTQNSEPAVAQLTQPTAPVQTPLAVPAVSATGLAAPDANSLVSSQSATASASLSQSTLDTAPKAMGDAAATSDPIASLDAATQSGFLSAASSGVQASSVNPASSPRQPLAAASFSTVASARAVSANTVSAGGSADGIPSGSDPSVQAIPVQANSGAPTAASLSASSGDLAAATVTESTELSRPLSSRAQSSDLSTQSSRKSRTAASDSSDTRTSDSIQPGTSASSSSYSSHVHEAASANTNDTATVQVQHVTGLADTSRYSTSASVATPLAGGASAHVFSAGTSSTDSSRSAQTSAQSTFSALDADSNSGQPIWTHTSARHAEAGYLDPNLGWVGVRADLQGHTVHATVMPSSTDAAQSLSQHMSGLGSYLQEQNSAVRSVGLATPAEQQAFDSAQTGAGPGNSSSSGNSSGSREDRSAESSTTAALDVRTISTPSVAGTRDSAPVLREGSRISLIA